MKRIDWKRLLLCIAAPLAVGGLAGLLTGNSAKLYGALRQPPFAPPSKAFPIVWTVLYVLMGVSYYLILQGKGLPQEKKRAVTLYWAQLAANFAWPLLFFRLEAYLPAFLWLALLLVLVVLMIQAFWKISKPAAWLQLPYLLWTAFAAYLNLAVYLLNG